MFWNESNVSSDGNSINIYVVFKHLCWLNISKQLYSEWGPENPLKFFSSRVDLRVLDKHMVHGDEIYVNYNELFRFLSSGTTISNITDDKNFKKIFIHLVE